MQVLRGLRGEGQATLRRLHRNRAEARRALHQFTGLYRPAFALICPLCLRPRCVMGIRCALRKSTHDLSGLGALDAVTCGCGGGKHGHMIFPPWPMDGWAPRAANATHRTFG